MWQLGSNLPQQGKINRLFAAVGGLGCVWVGGEQGLIKTTHRS